MLVTRTYRETISDALEACFSFEHIILSDYTVNTELTENTRFDDALRAAINLEDKASTFYLDVAEQCKSLLATIPAAFKKVAERRSNRKRALEALLR